MVLTTAMKRPLNVDVANDGVAKNWNETNPSPSKSAAFIFERLPESAHIGRITARSRKHPSTLSSLLSFWRTGARTVGMTDVILDYGGRGAD